MRYDRTAYFDQVSDSMFGGSMTQEQVDGQTVILAVWEYQQLADERWLAYMLATVYHECAARMWPITEYGSQSYLQGKEYWPYIGRGFVMITWEDNYRHASQQLNLTGGRDLVEHPDMALDSLIATRILFQGMGEGWFTGKKLSDYFNETRDDPINARQIVNGNDDDELIAGYHHDFLDALRLARIPDAVAPGAVETIDIALTRSSKNVLVSVTLDGQAILASGT